MSQRTGDQGEPYKEPQLGDAVYDPIFEQKGVITHGVYGMTEQYIEFFEEISVRFSNGRRIWYKPDELKPHWVESEQKYILP